MNEDAIIIKDVDFATKHGLKNYLVYHCIKEDNISSVKDLTEKLPFLGKGTISRSIKYFQDNGIVTKNNDEWEKIKTNMLSGKYPKNKICEWCNEKVAVLQEHHFPIPKEQGGSEVVQICPNCHYHFHYLERGYY